MIGIVNYGLGNVKAFANIYKKLDIPAVIVNCSDDLKQVTKLILPGVGSFDYAMQRLNDSGMKQDLDRLVIETRKPILGVCVGMQMFCASSEEGILPGLGWLNGEVRKFDFNSAKRPIPVPHMGWNNVRVVKENELFRDLGDDSRFYFLHSYFFKSRAEQDVIATADYGGEFACSLNERNIFGVQFHPEKSHHWGITLLANFAKL